MNKDLFYKSLFLTFAKSKVFIMTTKKQTRQELLAKFHAAKNKKQECLAELEMTMKETYEKRTGKKADNFFAL